MKKLSLKNSCTYIVYFIGIGVGSGYKFSSLCAVERSAAI